MSTAPTDPTPAPARRRTRAATALAGAALVTGTLLAGAGTSTAAPAPAVVGTWSAVVDREGVTNTSTLIFTASGKLCLRTESSTGSGSYVSRGDYLAYRANEKSDFGTVNINQVGKQAGDRFSSQGVSIIYDVNGKRTGQTFVKVTATRTSKSASC